MNADEQRKLDRLMCGSPGPSVQEKEELLNAILANPDQPAGPAPRWVWARWSLAAAGAGVFVVLLTLVFLPAVSTDEGGFTTRGEASGTASFELICKPASGDESPATGCRQGGLLAFRLVPPAKAAYFSAAGLGPDSKLRYYFPTPNTPSLPLAGDPLGSRGVVLAGDHPPGAYRVFGCFTAEPVEAARLRSAIEARLSGGSADLDLLERRLQVLAP